MDRDRYFVERCKNLPRKQRQTIIHLRCSNLRFKVQNEDLTLVTLSGIIMLASSKQSANANGLISVTVSGITTFLSALHS